ncbi:2-oxoacid:ferredoxin oxidoreductase subunit beta [candidate division KSB1 bacterium]
MGSIQKNVGPLPKEYKRDLKPVWCPGCGDFGVVNALYNALAKLKLKKENVAMISGIGCSSRLPGYIDTFGFNSIHGRAVPIATGVKLASPETTVITMGGDGDGFSIGGGHLPHTARRNVDITYIVMDNNIYGLTKGQLSPTSELHFKTKTSVYGSIDEPLDPVAMTFNYGMTFIARGFSLDFKHLTNLIIEGIRHKGFSFIHVLSPCVTFLGKDQYDIIKSKVVYLDESYDPSSRQEAFKIIEEKKKIPLGIIFKTKAKTYGDRIKELQKVVRSKDETKTFEECLNNYIP